MPSTILTLYPGSTYDLTFGGGGSGWSDNPLPAEINDGSDNPADPTYGFFRPGFADPRDFYAEYKLALPPLGIVSIASLRLIALVLAHGTAGTFDTDISALVRPAGSGYGASGDYYSAHITVTSENALGEVYHSLEFAAWTVNPLTSRAWTVADLAAMAFGIRFQCPDVDPVNNPAVRLARLRMVLEAVSSPADSSAVRTVGSTALRLFSRELLTGKITGPAVAADVGIGELFFLEHPRGRKPGGPGWGRKVWQRRPLFAISKSIDWLTGQTTITWEDPRRRMTRLWIPGLTTVGFSLDGKGLPLLHSGGGGPVCARASVKYVNRPGNPPDEVMMGATADILGVGAEGMCVEAPGDTNLVLNSTFSQGTGDAFDAWTGAASGTGTVTAETGRTGIDETGLRRSARVDVGITDASQAYIGADPVAVTSVFRVGIRTYNDYGSGKLSVIIRRGSDGSDWNDDTGTWDTAPVMNRIGNDAGGYAQWLSKNIDPEAGENISIFIGYFGEAGTVFAGIGFKAVVWSVDLCEFVDHIGTPLVTTTDPVTRVADVVRIPNNGVTAWWSFERGFSWTLGFMPMWNAADLITGEGGGALRIIKHVDHGDGGYSQIGYQKFPADAGNRFFFTVFSGGSAYTAQYVVAGNALLEPLRGRVVKLSGYYIGPDGERDLPPGQIGIAVNDDYDGGDVDTIVGVPTMDPVSTGYLGHAYSGVHESGDPLAWANAWIRQLDVSPFVLEPEEQQRKPS